MTLRGTRFSPLCSRAPLPLLPSLLLVLAFACGTTPASVSGTAVPASILVSTNGSDHAACGGPSAPCRTLRYTVEVQALARSLAASPVESSNSPPLVLLMGGAGAAGRFVEGPIAFNFSLDITGVEVEGYSPQVDFSLSSSAPTGAGGLTCVLPPGGTLSLSSVTMTGGAVTTGAGTSGPPVSGGGALAIVCLGACTVALANVTLANNSVLHDYECTDDWSCYDCGPRVGGGAVLVQHANSNGTYPADALTVLVSECSFVNNSFSDFQECGGGGALLVTSDIGAIVTVTSSSFTNNRGFSGGAIAALVASDPGPYTTPAFAVTVTASQFVGNVAGPGTQDADYYGSGNGIDTKMGGALGMHMLSSSSSVALAGCVFLNNSVVDDDLSIGSLRKQHGGAVSLIVVGASPILNISIDGCSFTGNFMAGMIGSGGAVYVGCPNPYIGPCTVSGAVQIADSTFESNSAPSSSMEGVSSFGGAMFIGGAPVQSTTAGHHPVTIANLTVTLTDCQLRDNVANGGGAIYFGFVVMGASQRWAASNVTLRLTSTVLQDNRAGFAAGNSWHTLGGAGLMTLFPEVAIRPSFLDPQVSTLDPQTVVVSLDSCIVANNSADMPHCASCNGGGLFLQNVALLLTNCTVEQNRASSAGGGVYGASGTAQYSSVGSTVGQNAATTGQQVYWGALGPLSWNSSLILAGHALSEVVLSGTMEAAVNQFHLLCPLGTVLTGAPYLTTVRQYPPGGNDDVFPLDLLVTTMGCEPCNAFSYTVQESWATDFNASGAMRPLCLDCPVGALCGLANGLPLPAPDYWGTLSSEVADAGTPPRCDYVQCPADVCNPPNDPVEGPRYGPDGPTPVDSSKALPHARDHPACDPGEPEGPLWQLRHRMHRDTNGCSVLLLRPGQRAGVWHHGVPALAGVPIHPCGLRVPGSVCVGGGGGGAAAGPRGSRARGARPRGWPRRGCDGGRGA